MKNVSFVYLCANLPLIPSTRNHFKCGYMFGLLYYCYLSYILLYVNAYKYWESLRNKCDQGLHGSIKNSNYNNKLSLISNNKNEIINKVCLLKSLIVDSF